MGKITTIALASMFMMSSKPVLANDSNNEVNSNDWQISSQCADQYRVMNDHFRDGYTSMLKGITLTEQQRLQLRDLMGNFRRELIKLPNVNNENYTLFNLVKSPEFDEVAVRSEIEKEMQNRINYQVEMVKVHHQLYQILTPQQKAALDNNFAAQSH